MVHNGIEYGLMQLIAETQVRKSLYAAILLTFAQGMVQLRAASGVYQYDLNLETVVRIWRGGSILRARLLEDVWEAFHERPLLSNLLLDPKIGQAVLERQADLRSVVRTAVDLGLPAPGFMAALAYFDSYRSDWLPANLIQAQRDFFGAHTFERVDIRGIFHANWR